MNLKTYINSERGRAAALAARLDGVSPSYLSQMASGKASISPKRAAEIEAITNKAVTRQEMFPNDWQTIWPELAVEAHRATDPTPESPDRPYRHPIDPAKIMSAEVVKPD